MHAHMLAATNFSKNVKLKFPITVFFLTLTGLFWLSAAVGNLEIMIGRQRIAHYRDWPACRSQAGVLAPMNMTFLCLKDESNTKKQIFMYKVKKLPSILARPGWLP